MAEEGGLSIQKMHSKSIYCVVVLNFLNKRLFLGLANRLLLLSICARDDGVARRLKDSVLPKMVL